MLESVWIDCPYCGEQFETDVDCSAGGQRYIEDCPVCCQPIELATEVDLDGSLRRIAANRNDD
jgi:hypothetical protein